MYLQKQQEPLSVSTYSNHSILFFLSSNSTYTIMIFCHIVRTVSRDINIILEGIVLDMKQIYMSTTNMCWLFPQLHEATTNKPLYP